MVTNDRLSVHDAGDNRCYRWRVDLDAAPYGRKKMTPAMVEDLYYFGAGLCCFSTICVIVTFAALVADAIKRARKQS